MAELILVEATRPGDFRKVVAIKRLLPQHALDPQLRQMFLDEARLMARMSHPHIPQVYDVCEPEEPSGGAGAALATQNGQIGQNGAIGPSDAPFDAAAGELGGQLPYFIMEYVHGRDLRAVLNEAEGPLPIPMVVTIGAAVAAGLHHAHELRAESGELLEVVHRDVSPSNVLVSFDGVVKLTDFGVAKWRQQRSLTVQGQLKGKLAHMSPEQCFGHALDRRSDVFSLGTVLYEMAFGQPAFAADSDYELMSRIVRGEVRLPEGARTRVPPPLVELIVRSLARPRDERPPTAQAVQIELERLGRAERLSSSALDTATYLETLFGARVSAWRAARQSGRSLAEHLSDQAVASPSPSGPPPSVNRTLTDGAACPAAAADPTEWTQGTGAVRDPTAGLVGSSLVEKPPSVVTARGLGLAGLAVAAGLAGLAIARSRGGDGHAGAPAAVRASAFSSAPAPAPAPASGPALRAEVLAGAHADVLARAAHAEVPGARAPGVAPSSAGALEPAPTSPGAGLARERRPSAPTRRAPSAHAVPVDAPLAPRRPRPAAAATEDDAVARAAGSPEVEIARAAEISASPRPEVKVWDPDSPVPP
jgi:serine/threonine protein kinase